jgi:hypothetical protein
MGPGVGLDVVKKKKKFLSIKELKPRNILPFA